jgi:hypothetical protein
MKLHVRYNWVLLGLSLLPSYTCTDFTSGPTYQYLDPITDLRTPYSLTELLRDGLIKTHDLVTRASGNASELLHEAAQTLHDLVDGCAHLANSSRLHAIYADDAQFLQAMIDRIDQMLASLESKSMTIQDREQIQRNRMVLEKLKENLK